LGGLLLLIEKVQRVLSNLLLIGGGLFLPYLHHHTDAGVFAKKLCVLPKEVPVERVEGAGLRALSLFGVELAGGTMISHFILIGRTCGIGLGGKKSAVGKKDHAKNIGNHDPVVSIEIHLGIPAQDGLGFVATQEKVVS